MKERLILAYHEIRKRLADASNELRWYRPDEAPLKERLERDIQLCCTRIYYLSRV